VKSSLPLKIDLHTHSHYSEDATTTLRELVLCAKKRGLDGVALTDHDTVLGARRLSKQKHILVIPGVEIETLNGHLLALNVLEHVKPKQDITETAERIRQLGGIAVIAHPAVVIKTGLGNKIASVSNLDAVEVINSAAFPFFLTTYQARRLAERLKLPETAGSDAHHPNEIGKAFTLIDADLNRDDVIDAIRKGRTTPFGEPISWMLRLKRGALGIQRILQGH